MYSTAKHGVSSARARNPSGTLQWRDTADHDESAAKRLRVDPTILRRPLVSARPLGSGAPKEIHSLSDPPIKGDNRHGGNRWIRSGALRAKDKLFKHGFGRPLSGLPWSHADGAGKSEAAKTCLVAGLMAPI
jgi:hypothetical protein